MHFRMITAVSLVIRVCAAMLSHVQLCNPMDCGPSGFFVHGISQARIPEWVAISCSSGAFRLKDQTCVSSASCIGRQILYHCTSWGSLSQDMLSYKHLYCSRIYFHHSFILTHLFCNWKFVHLKLLYLFLSSPQHHFLQQSPVCLFFFL